MKIERPVLDDAKVSAFLKVGTLPPNQGQKPAKTSKGASRKEKVCTKDDDSGLSKRVVTKDKLMIVKFMVELPLELRRKIKYKSVHSDTPMNSLIVDVLQNHFK